MIFLPINATIAEEKLTQYLLVPLLKDDKSKFLGQGGYILENWRRLEADLRSQVLTQPAEFLEETPYGTKYRIKTILKSINGLELPIITIWMITNKQAKFITLIPDP